MLYFLKYAYEFEETLLIDTAQNRKLGVYRKNENMSVSTNLWRENRLLTA